MIRTFAQHPTAANLLMLAFLVIGIGALPSLRRETFPDFTPSKIQVLVAYPGASPEDVEESICQRIEEVLEGVADVDSVVSEAREGVGTVTLEMREGGDLQALFESITSEIDGITDFPEEAEDPVVERLGQEDQVVSIAVTGEIAAADLEAYCKDLKTRLRRSSREISLVEIIGFSQRQIRIELSTDSLRRYGLTESDVADQVNRQTVDLPAGSIASTEREFLLRFADQRRTVEEYQRLVVVGGSTGAELTLGDIATVRDVFELDESKVLYNGQRAGILQIRKTKSQDSLRVVAAVRAFLEVESERVPPGVTLALTDDVSSIVADRLELLVRNGWQGMVLVLLTLWLFFNFRLAFWVTMGLPVSFLGAIFVMAQIGYSLNMMTMVALLLGIGLLMDDAIVIAENVATRRRSGDSSAESAIRGTGQVVMGVFSSFVTTACVFVPLSFLSGDMGKVLRVLPVVLIVVLAVSLAEAFLILPNHLAHALHGWHPDQDPPMRRRFQAAIEWVRERVVGRCSDWCTSHRYLFVGSLSGLLAITGGMVLGGHVEFVAFPELEGNVVQARVLLPQGTPLARTEQVVGRIEAALLEVAATEYDPIQPDGQKLIQARTVRFNENADAKESGPHLATLSVDLLSTELRNARVDDLLGSWREAVGEIPGIVQLQFKEPTLGPAGLPIEIEVSGDDLDALAVTARRIRSWFGRFAGVFDLSDDLRDGKPEFRVRLREGATALGLDAQRIASQLRAAYYGTTAAEVQVGPDRYEIDVRLAAADAGALDTFDRFVIQGHDGAQIPLDAVARIEPGRGRSRIARVDGVRTVTVTGDVDPEVVNSSELIRRFRSEALAEIEAAQPGVSIAIRGESESTADTFGSMLYGLLFGLIGVYILLSLQFRSYVLPFVVMAAVPLCLIGVVWGHFAMGLPLTMPSMLGFASLAGIVVNDSILLVAFVQHRRSEGASAVDAARQASRDRFRAVLLTSVTTIAGLVPLMLERSMQAQVLIPLAVSIVFGLLASTVLVLFLVPSLYAMVGRPDDAAT